MGQIPAPIAFGCWYDVCGNFTVTTSGNTAGWPVALTDEVTAMHYDHPLEHFRIRRQAALLLTGSMALLVAIAVLISALIAS